MTRTLTKNVDYFMWVLPVQKHGCICPGRSPGLQEAGQAVVLHDSSRRLERLRCSSHQVQQPSVASASGEQESRNVVPVGPSYRTVLNAKSDGVRTVRPRTIKMFSTNLLIGAKRFPPKIKYRHLLSSLMPHWWRSLKRCLLIYNNFDSFRASAPKNWNVMAPMCWQF